MNRKLRNEELKRLSAEEFKTAEKAPLVIVLDNVRSLHNVGSVFRTADAFLIEAVYLCGITARPPHREIRKTALGATEAVAWSYFEQTMDAVQQLKKDGYKVIAVEQTAQSRKLVDLKLDKGEKFALVFGHEVHGVEQEVVDASHLSVEIPQFGTKHSLNISVSVGVVCWDILRQLGAV